MTGYCDHCQEQLGLAYDALTQACRTDGCLAFLCSTSCLEAHLIDHDMLELEHVDAEPLTPDR